mgnify:CR=1 FL=1
MRGSDSQNGSLLSYVNLVERLPVRADVVERDARLRHRSRCAPVSQGRGPPGSALTENRDGFVVEAALTLASGTAERSAAVGTLNARSTRHITLGADKGYDAASFVETLRTMCLKRQIRFNLSGIGPVEQSAGILVATFLNP